MRLSLYPYRPVALRFFMPVAAVLLCLGSAAPARAQFSGPYAPANWAFTNIVVTGSVDTTAAPAAITLTGGGSRGSTFPGSTRYSILAVGSGDVAFTWDYTTEDSFAWYDPFEFSVNGTPVIATENFITDQSGSFSMAVNAGDTLEFRISTDSLGGPGSVTISNFTGPTGVADPQAGASAPEPGTLALLGPLAGVGMVWFGARRSRRSAGIPGSQRQKPSRRAVPNVGAVCCHDSNIKGL